MQKRLALTRMFSGDIFIQGNSEPGFLWNKNVSILNDGLWQPFDKIVPEGNIRGMKFKGKKVWDGGAKVNGCQRANRTTDVMRRHRHGMCVSKLRNGLSDG